jgi:hypothetical protein
MGKQISPLAKKALDEMKSALTEFGRYSFFDKGPQEVMDMPRLSNEFRAAGVEPCATALKEILAIKDDEAGEMLVSAFLVRMQDWDEFWEAHSETLGDYL